MRNKPPKCVSDSASNEKSSACRPLLMLELTETHFRRPRHKPSKMDGFWRVAKMSDFAMQTSLLKRPRESMMHFSGFNVGCACREPSKSRRDGRRGKEFFQARPMEFWSCLSDAEGVIHTSPGHSPWVHRPKHDFQR